jgi:hypothetical protein
MPAAPSGTDSGLLAPGTAPEEAVPVAVPVPFDATDGVGIGSVLRGSSCGVQPTRAMAAAAAAMLPVMNATRRVNVCWLMAPAR